ncbi:hypothetical protein DY000_02058864 [Brassica cretica]|uniref:ATP phosphoribosyltransferase n=1 Tax=Brassica cretica TaxID=69181 RepID=A0ABQ7B2L8_BRACR|nr:hypothetical protein DY000_02058864 [Brassica cretica]
MFVSNVPSLSSACIQLSSSPRPDATIRDKHQLAIVLGTATRQEPSCVHPSQLVSDLRRSGSTLQNKGIKTKSENIIIRT